MVSSIVTTMVISIILTLSGLCRKLQIPDVNGIF